MLRKREVGAAIDAHVKAGSDEIERWWELRLASVGARAMRSVRRR